MAWGQRIKRELGSRNVFYNKAYTYNRQANRSALDDNRSQDQNDKQSRYNSIQNKKFSQIAGKSAGKKTRERKSMHINTQSVDNIDHLKKTWLKQSTLPNGNTVSSFPMPFHRHNQDHRVVRQNLGYINTGTGTNPSDPNSMVDMGPSRNATYNIDTQNIPEVSNTVFSKALGIHDYGTTNQTFFSFGSRNTNFRKHMMKTSDSR